MDPPRAWSTFREALAADLADTQGTRSFAGVQLQDGVVAFNPRLPEELEAVGVALVHQGQRLRVDVARESASRCPRTRVPPTRRSRSGSGRGRSPSTGAAVRRSPRHERGRLMTDTDTPALWSAAQIGVTKAAVHDWTSAISRPQTPLTCRSPMASRTAPPP